MRGDWLLPLAVMLVAAAPAAAQEPGDTTLQGLLARKVAAGKFQTVASASRFAERAADAPAAVTVVTAEDIRRMGAVSIADALRMVPGLNVSEGVEGSPAVTARNAVTPISPRLLVLLDGRPTALEIYSTTDWSSLAVTLNQIEAIEVVRGPGSTLYGASAYDAVINITTRRPAAARSAEVSAASGGSTEHHVDLTYGQVVGALRLDGFFSSDRQDPTGSWMGRLDQLPQAHLYDLRKGGVRLGWSAASGADLQLSGGVADGTTSMYLDYTSPVALTPSTQKFVYAEFVHANLPGEWMLRSHLFLSRTSSPMEGMIVAGVPVQGTDYDSRTNEGELTLGKVFASHRLLAGGAAKGMWSDALPPILAEDRSQTLYGAFLQDTWETTKHVDVVVGARYDADDNGRGAFSPRAALLLKPTLAHTIRVSAGQAFRIPTIVESYMSFTTPIAPGIDFRLHGDPDLKAERITSYELGYVGVPMPMLSLSLALFRNQFGNAVGIERQYMTIPGVGTIPVDLGFASGKGGATRGGEASAELTPRPWLRAALNYAYTELTDSMGAALAITPKHKVNAELGVRPVAPLWLNATYHYRSSTDFTSQIDPSVLPALGGGTLPARGIVTLNARLGIGRGVEASVFTQDLFDQTYQDVVGGQKIGRRIIGRLDWRF